MHDGLEFDDAKARRNALVLAAAQALYGSCVMVLIATGGIVGTMLATDRSLATLPITTFVLGTALTTIPASLLMRRIGRRAGFMIGAAGGVASSLAAAYAIWAASFWLFALATLLLGVYQAFSQYYRFAAADLASAGFRPKAISWVLVGGIAGALFVPGVIGATKEMFGPALFVGTYLFSAAMAAAAIGVLTLLHSPPFKLSETSGEARPLLQILRQPRLIAAMLAGMTAYGVMNFVMTSTPIAMVECGFSVESSAWVIQWHAIAMFAPSLVTGHLISRFGVDRMVIAGMLLLLLAAGAGLSGIGFLNFSVALVLLGLGWNFGYVGGTTMVTETYRPAERSKVQAVNDFAIFAAVAIASLASGALLNSFGWTVVNLAILPFVAAAIGGLLLLGFRGPGFEGRSAV